MKTQRIKSRTGLIGFCLLLSLGLSAQAAVVVIGNPANDVGELSKQQVKRIFLGKTSSLPDGTIAEVIDLPADDPATREFYGKVIHKTPSQLKSYWAKRVFTGKGSPPDKKPDAQAIKQWVSEAKGRIGYIDSDAVDDTVQILFRVP